MKVLLVEYDNTLRERLTECFQQHLWQVISVADGLAGVDWVDKELFDLYIINIHTPLLTGVELLRYIRKTEKLQPIIMLIESLEIEELRLAYQAGCSDYLKIPFLIEELELKVNHLMHHPSGSRVYFNKDFYFCMETYQFFYCDKGIGLRYKERRLCHLLIQNLNTIVPYETIYTYVWESDTNNSYPLRQLLVELRKKLPYDVITTRIKDGLMIEVR